MTTTITKKSIYLLFILAVFASCSKDDTPIVDDPKSENKEKNTEENKPPSKVSNIELELLNKSLLKITWEAATDQNRDAIYYDVIINDVEKALKTEETFLELNFSEYLPNNNDTANAIKVELNVKIKAYDGNNGESVTDIIAVVGVNSNPESFELTNIYINPEKNEYALSWTPSVDPDNELVVYDIFLNEIQIAGDFIIGSTNITGNVNYQDLPIDLSNLRNQEVKVEIIAKDGEGGERTITTVVDPFATDIDLGGA